MNKQRRKEIEAVKDRILECIDELESIRDDEQDAYDNLPESFQEGERGEQMQEYIYLIEAALDSLEDANSSLEEVI